MRRQSPEDTSREEQQLTAGDLRDMSNNPELRYSPVTTSHTRNLSRVVPRVIQREDKICHA